MQDLPQSHLVLANITTVAGAMKKNSRWAGSSSYTGTAQTSEGKRRARAAGINSSASSSSGLRVGAGDELSGAGGGSIQEGEEELMGGFVELRWKVVESEGVQTIPPSAFVRLSY